MEEARLTGEGRGSQRDGALWGDFCSVIAGAWWECKETTTGRYMLGLYHAELYKWGAAPCIRFFAQQAASVGLSELEWYDRIFGARTTSGRHCSGRAVAGIYCNLWHHKGDCCNNPGVMLWNSLSFSQQLGYQDISEFSQWNTSYNLCFCKF